jgi:glycosyltransferase involved in cell wall biosynthesis
MLRSIFSKPYSRLYLVGDNADWALDEETKQLARVAKRLGIKAHRVKKMRFNIPQVVHYASQFSLLDPSIYKSKNRISIDYFHGKPEHGESYKKCFEAMVQRAEYISRIRVSNREMEDALKNYGVAPEKIQRIPIGIDTAMFPPQTPDKKSAARAKLGIPADAVVVGSFQKDGVGWGDGNEPKLIKGPDIFLKVIEKLRLEIPNLWILLSGPSRGYVRNGLDALGVPYRHEYLSKYADVSNLYDALDLYIIASREEGGPKACLESMAKGIPLITTEVGQCKDLVLNGKNAMMAPVEDVLGLSRRALEVLRNTNLSQSLIREGFKTAEENSYESQTSLWHAYFKNLITS